MVDEETIEELQVTFNPALYLQRRGWVFDQMRREGVSNVCAWLAIRVARHSC